MVKIDDKVNFISIQIKEKNEIGTSYELSGS